MIPFGAGDIQMTGDWFLIQLSTSQLKLRGITVSDGLLWRAALRIPVFSPLYAVIRLWPCLERHHEQLKALSSASEEEEALCALPGRSPIK